jgi:hypothetical protein
MGHHQNDSDHASPQGEGTAVSEGGSGSLNPDTALGGADSVPDTPDVNTAISDEVDVNEESQEGRPPRNEGQPG